MQRSEHTSRFTSFHANPHLLHSYCTLCLAAPRCSNQNRSRKTEIQRVNIEATKHRLRAYIYSRSPACRRVCCCEVREVRIIYQNGIFMIVCPSHSEHIVHHKTNTACAACVQYSHHTHDGYAVQCTLRTTPARRDGERPVLCVFRNERVTTGRIPEWQATRMCRVNCLFIIMRISADEALTQKSHETNRWGISILPFLRSAYLSFMVRRER